MFRFFKKKTTDLVKEWNKLYTHEVITNDALSEQDRKDIVSYVHKNKAELTVVISSLTEGARLKNGDYISKDLFNTILYWMHKRVWASIIIGIKSSDSSFRKCYDLYCENERKLIDNPEEALARYKEIIGEDE